MKIVERILIGLVTLCVVFFNAGCATNAPPYTAKQKSALAHAIIGQSLDVVTTDMALNSGKFDEANGIWWNPDDRAGMLAGKVVLMGLTYIYCQYVPEARTAAWAILGVSGYGAATWNTYQMIENDISPWDDPQ